MGTRADFYVGRGTNAEWLGSIAWDGHPKSIPDTLRAATTERLYREQVDAFLKERDDATRPEDGWPWSWEDSRTTDFAYAFDGGDVQASCFGHGWFNALQGETEDEANTNEKRGKVAVFPNMKDRQNVTFGKRSGVLIIGG